MSQDEMKIANHEEQDDVEAHGKKFAANDEGKTEGEGDDDFEAHVHRSNAARKQ